MVCMLTKRLQKIDEELKSLEIGKVIEVYNLDEEEGTSICKYYKKKYNIRGPSKDEKNPGKYFVVFSLKPRRAENA